MTTSNDVRTDSKTTLKIKLSEYAVFFSGLNPRFAFLGIYAQFHGIPLYFLPLGSAIYGLVSLISEIPTGFISDKIGHRNSTIIAYLLNSLAILSLIIIPNEYGYVFSSILLGLAGSFESGSFESYVYEAAKEGGQSFKKIWSRINGNLSIGYFSGSFIGFFAAQILGEGIIVVNWIIALEMITYLISAALMIVSPDNEIDLNSKESIQEINGGIKKLILLIRKNKVLRNLTISKTLTYFAVWFLQGASLAIFIQRNIDIKWVAISFMTSKVIGYIIGRHGYTLLGKFELPKLILYVKLLICFLLFLLCLSKNHTITIVCVSILIGLSSVEEPFVSSRINKEIPQKFRASMLSIISFLMRLWTGTMPLLLSLIMSQWGAEASLMIHASLLLIGSIYSYFILKRCGCV